MKVKLGLAIVLLTAGCGQAVEESRINLDNLDPGETATPERVQRHLAETAVFGDFDCVSGQSRCGFDGIVYTCGFDGESHSYFETGSRCDNRDLLEFDRDGRRTVDLRVIEQAEAASNSTSTNTSTQNSSSNTDFSSNGNGNTSTSNGESRNSGGGGGPQGL